MQAIKNYIVSEIIRPNDINTENVKPVLLSLGATVVATVVFFSLLLTY
jgi:hypothetical protein